MSSNTSPHRIADLRQKLWRWAFGTCTAAVLALALLPRVPPMVSTGWDKGNHVLAFTALAVLGLWAYPRRSAMLLAGLLAYGGLIEILQSLTPSRVAEWPDLLADALGLLMGWGLVRALERFGSGKPGRKKR